MKPDIIYILSKQKKIKKLISLEYWHGRSKNQTYLLSHKIALRYQESILKNNQKPMECPLTWYPSEDISKMILSTTHTKTDSQDLLTNTISSFKQKTLQNSKNHIKWFQAQKGDWRRNSSSKELHNSKWDKLTLNIWKGSLKSKKQHNISTKGDKVLCHSLAKDITLQQYQRGWLPQYAAQGVIFNTTMKHLPNKRKNFFFDFWSYYKKWWMVKEKRGRIQPRGQEWRKPPSNTKEEWILA